jgi:hypothetical protein
MNKITNFKLQKNHFQMRENTSSKNITFKKLNILIFCVSSNCINIIVKK